MAIRLAAIGSVHGPAATRAESGTIGRMKPVGSSVPLRLWLGCVALALAAGCDGRRPPEPTADGTLEPPSAAGGVSGVSFLPQVESNREDDGTVNDLEFVDIRGEPVPIRQYNGQKNLVLVFTRGFAGQLCPYCTTQTSRLIANYEQFQQRDAEVLLVYPGSQEQLPLFQQAGLAAAGADEFPFPVLLDVDLAAVKRLGIAAQLASPSTYIIDKEGKVRLSYVGSNPADRPSIQAMLDQLDRIQRDAG